MKTSQVSTLPFFKIGDAYETPIGPKEKPQKVVEITCPRSWCQGTFVVVIKKWWSKNIWETRRSEGGLPIKRQGFRTRACPYCTNMSKVPKRPKSL